MSYFDERPNDLVQDTKQFLESEYGKYLVGVIQDKCSGTLGAVADINVEHPERYAAKYSALKEVLDLIYSPLDDHTPSHG
jgi:hypothetical protein